MEFVMLAFLFYKKWCLMWRIDSGSIDLIDLSTLYYSFEFDYQQRVLKAFPGSGYLHSEDGVV